MMSGSLCDKPYLIGQKNAVSILSLSQADVRDFVYVGIIFQCVAVILKYDADF